MTGPIRAVIADDHGPTRAGVKMALEADGIRVCAEAADATGAVEAVVAERPDVCLVDINMPGGGIAAAAEISTRVPDTRVVMLTVSASDDDLFSSLRAGASGYLLKDTDPDRLPLALRGVLSGEAALPRSLVARVLDEFSERSPQGRRARSGSDRGGAPLTNREREVLEQLREGLTTAEIGERLSVSAVTVRRHISEALRKLRVPDRQAALELLSDHPPGE